MPDYTDRPGNSGVRRPAGDREDTPRTVRPADASARPRPARPIGEEDYVPRSRAARPAESAPVRPRPARPASEDEYTPRPRTTRPVEGAPVRPRPARPVSEEEYTPRSRAARPAESAPVRPRPARPASEDEYAPRPRTTRPAEGTPVRPRPARPADGAQRSVRQTESADRPRAPRTAATASGVRPNRPVNHAKTQESAPVRRRRDDDRRYSEKAKNFVDRTPKWIQLAMVAVVFVMLIGVSLKMITNLANQPERTTIQPISANTAVPEETQIPDNGQTPEDSAVPAQSEQPIETSEPQATNVSAQPQNTEAVTPQATQNDVVVQPTQNTEPLSAALRTATIRMAGDIIIDTEMLDATYNKGSDSYNFEPYFEYIGDTLSSPDYTMINIDASLRKGKYGYSGYPQFTTPPVILNVVKNVGVDMITMCNNHMLDGYCDGLVESVNKVIAAGLDHIGGYVDEADSLEPEIYEINGIRVGFVSYTHSTNTMENYCDDRAKTLVHRFSTANFENDVKKAREAGAEFVVAVAHWGTEYQRQPDKDEVYWAQKMVAAGVDLIIGGHPHVVQPAEYITATDSNGNRRTALCIYSMGNFLSQHRASHTDYGVVFEFTLQDDGEGHISVVNPGYVPVYVWTFKNAAGNDDYRVMPIGVSLENPPADMSSSQYEHMKECWNDALSIMGENSVITALKK